jgi:hypothetical protein
MAQRAANRRTQRGRPSAGPAPAAAGDEAAQAAGDDVAAQAASTATPLPPPAPPGPIAEAGDDPPADGATAGADAGPATDDAVASGHGPADGDDATTGDGSRAPALDGVGVEVLLTLGDEVGCALYADGRHVLDLDLGGHPLRKRRSYDESIGGAARDQLGGKRWSRRVQRALRQVLALLRPRQLYVSGPNASRLRGDLPPDTRLLS